jgi:hypothetical protein
MSYIYKDLSNESLLVNTINPKIKNNINKTNPYICKIVANDSQIITINTPTTITEMTATNGTAFNNELNNMYDGVNSRINIKKTGKYRISANIGSIDNNLWGTDYRGFYLYITKNSDKIFLCQSYINFFFYPITTTNCLMLGETEGIFELTEGDYIELGVWQNFYSAIKVGGWNSINPEYKNPCLATLAAELL